MGPNTALIAQYPWWHVSSPCRGSALLRSPRPLRPDRPQVRDSGNSEGYSVDALLGMGGVPVVLPASIRAPPRASRTGAVSCMFIEKCVPWGLPGPARGLMAMRADPGRLKACIRATECHRVGPERPLPA